ncbi:YqaA family protein [Aureimonas sp. ME7]|uniref:YqaA family protein n=1 Tax=Aureimonas sp. ME7 TaxID=2744252 RepID=UPI0015F3C880|nr:YqaA family protein [Aureimonas sp. ME7]
MDLTDAGAPGVYGALLLSAFLSATLLPGSSELLLASLLVAGRGDPVLLTLIAALGNTLGSVFNWWCGRFLMHRQDARWFPVSRAQLDRGARVFARWGRPALLLSWMPVVGDALTLVAGLLGVRLLPFVFLVGAGKALRYAFVTALTLGVVQF